VPAFRGSARIGGRERSAVEPVREIEPVLEIEPVPRPADIPVARTGAVD